MNIFNPASVIEISIEPEEAEILNQWIEQGDITSFLEKEIQDEYIILYASLPFTFINSVLIPSTEFEPSDIEDLLRWDVSPSAGWSIACSSDDVWVEPPLAESSSYLLRQGEQLIFSRRFSGNAPDPYYYELSQRLSHLLEIHFVAERKAWCKFNDLGDIEDIIKITELAPNGKWDGGIIISIQKKALEEYLTITESLLIRMFDFTRYKTGNFNGWNEGEEKVFDGENNIFGRAIIEPGYASYSRGIQIADFKFEKQKLIDRTWGHPRAKKAKQYVTFVTEDRRDGAIKEISCDPKALANYFIKSDLPLEISPVFFRPEVLSKYKSDREKYNLKSRSISCREAWELRTFDVNSAGQVHTFIVYLGNLPYEEQLHWKQYNEAPKAPISTRSQNAEVAGEWYTEYDPLESLKDNLSSLSKGKIKWWVLRDPRAIDKVHYPYTTSRDEWADEILNLDQLLVEGLEEKWLRAKAKELGRTPDDKLRALRLLEECLIGVGFEEDHARKIMGILHEVHNLRSKLKGHIAGQEAAEIRKNALKNFGSLKRHFENMCAECDESVGIITRALE